MAAALRLEYLSYFLQFLPLYSMSSRALFLHLSVWFHNEPTPMLMILLAGQRRGVRVVEGWENHLFFLGQTMQSSNKQPPSSHTLPSTTKEGRTQRDFFLHFFFNLSLSLVKV